VDVKNVTYYNLHYYLLKNEVMTNKTACMDGHSHAWENSCKHNGTACVFLFNNGFLPDGGVLRKVNGTWYRCDVARTNNEFLCSGTEGVRSLIFRHNGTATNGTQYWHDDARGGWFGWTGSNGIWASTENQIATSTTYENSTYGIRVQYPSDWSVQESKSSVVLSRTAIVKMVY
jgi:hypothetical protein